MMMNILVKILIFCLIYDVCCDDEINSNLTTSSTRRTFTRLRMSTKLTTETPAESTRSSTSTPLKTSSQSLVDRKNSSSKSTKSESSYHVDVTTESIASDDGQRTTLKIESSTEKSLHVRNCGERIGDDVPFIALLVHTNSLNPSAKSRRTLSKGVLISEKFVLSTVSSIYRSEALWRVTSVRLGDFVTWNSLAVRDKSLVQEIGIDEIFYHEKKDLALIRLREPATFSDVIRPACLPLSVSLNFAELKSHLCKRSMRKGRHADVTLESASTLSFYDCSQFYQRRLTTPLNRKTEFCVWDKTGDDCAGDIGNPLFSVHNDRFHVVGLRSYVETSEEITDPPSFPGVYVNVGEFQNWISHVMTYDETKDVK